MKKKLFENIGDNIFKLRKNLSKNEGFDATGEEIDATITLNNPDADLEDPDSVPEEEVNVIVTFTYYEPIRGSRDEPDAEESIEITSVKRQDNKKEIINLLSDTQITTLEKSILNRTSSYDPD
jgi:hypothetical protein